MASSTLLEFTRKLLGRLSKEIGWLHHYHGAHGITSLNDLYLCAIGFAPQEYAAYGLHENPRSRYISTKMRFFGIPRVHGPYMFLLKDKSIFYSFMIEAGYRKHLPARHTWSQSNRSQHSQVEDGTYAMKPVRGSGGKDVYIVEVIEGELRIPQDYPHETLPDNFEDEFVLEERIESADYARRIFDGSLNTIRLLTAWDYESDAPFIAAAAHRFGTNKSAPTDNVSRGGIAHYLDVDTGDIGPAITVTTNGDYVRSTSHPDTKIQIEGVHVPQWNKLKAFIIDVASQMTFCPFVGWDVAIDSSGQFVIIEANPTPDLSFLQIHTPLRSDERVTEFLRYFNLS